MTDSNAPRYYLVRAMGQSQEEYAAFFEGGVVAVGWSRVPLCDFDSVEEAVAVVSHQYLRRKAPTTAGKKRNEVRRFLRMKVGDRIVVPVSRGIRLATVSGPAFHEPDAVGIDLANRRRVTYRVGDNGKPLVVSRRSLTERFRRTLRAPGGAVRDLSEYGPEIERLFEGSDARTADATAEDERALAFRDELLRRIREGDTFLQAGGRGLERLVAALLEAEGYAAEVLPNRTFEGLGDIDVKATRSDPFLHTTLLVQVKHHWGESGPLAAEQLENAKPQLSADSKTDYVFAVVTSADASEDLLHASEDGGIIVVDGQRLAEWIHERIGDLPEWARRDLRVSDVPTLL